MSFRVKVATFFGGTLMLATGIFYSVSAQNSTPGSGLSISPTRTELSIDKGKSATVKLSIKNVSGGDIVAKAEVNDFEADGESGDPKIILDKNRQSVTSIKPFLIGVSDLKLKKGESRNVSLPVQIPSSTPSGAYYGVIRYSALPVGQVNQGQQGKVSLTASVGSLVLIEVPGNIINQIQVQNLLVYRGEKSSLFFLGAPNKVGVKIKNTGNGFAKPFGRVSITNSLTRKEVFSYEVNNTSARGNVLPGSARLFKNDIKGIKYPGRYQVTAGISQGNGGEVITVVKSFWYIPVWLIFILIALLVSVAVSGKLFISRRRKNLANK